MAEDKDQDRREKLLELAQKGSKEAQVSLALLAELKLGGKQDLVLARQMWVRAAKQGDAWAQSQAALFLEKGLGGPVDKEGARKLREAALRQNSQVVTAFKSDTLEIATGVQAGQTQETELSLEFRPELEGKIALVVEDAKPTRMAISNMLQSAGMTVLEAENGHEGFEMLMKNPHISIVLSDIHMPLLNGLGLAKKIRSVKGFKALPLVMITTETRSTAISEGRRLRVSGWLIKPVSPEKLGKVIDKLLVMPASNAKEDRTSA